MPLPLSSLALALTVSIIWGVNFVVIKWGGQAFPPFLLTFYRFFFTAIPFVFLIKRPKIPLKDLVGYNLVMGVLYFTVLFVAMDLGMGAALASVLVQSQSIFTLLFSLVYLKDKPEPRHWWGVAISLAGLLFFVNDFSGAQKIAPLLLVITSAVCLGFSNTLLKKVNPPNMLSYLVWGSLVPIGPLYLLCLFWEKKEPITYLAHHFSGKGIAAVAYMAIFSTLGGFGIWGNLLKKHSPKKVAPFALLVPFFGVACSNFFLGETLTKKQIYGSILLISGLAVSQGLLRMAVKSISKLKS